MYRRCTLFNSILSTKKIGTLSKKSHIHAQKIIKSYYEIVSAKLWHDQYAF